MLFYVWYDVRKYVFERAHLLNSWGKWDVGADFLRYSGEGQEEAQLLNSPEKR